MSKLLWGRQISAFCGLGTEQPLKADQAGPVPNGCGQWRHTPHPLQLQIIHSQHPSSSLGIASTLLRWVSLASVRSLEATHPGRQWSWGKRTGPGSSSEPAPKRLALSFLLQKARSRTWSLRFLPVLTCHDSAPPAWEAPLGFESHAFSMRLLEEKPGVWFEGEGRPCSLSLTEREAALQKHGECF